MRRAAAWAAKKAPVRSVSVTVRHSSSVSSSTGVECPVPALLTRTSSPPSSPASSSTMACASAGSLTSARRTNARRPWPRTSSAASLAPCSSRCQVMPTSQSSVARRTAVARPMPESEPVTITSLDMRRALPHYEGMYQTVRLTRGRHAGPSGGTCVMELASLLAGEPFSDRAASACPVIGGVLRAYNDAADDERRQQLYGMAASVVETAPGDAELVARVEHVVAWTRARTRRPWRRMMLGAAVRAEDFDEMGVQAVKSLGRLDDRAHDELIELVRDLLRLGRPPGADVPSSPAASCPAPPSAAAPSAV